MAFKSRFMRPKLIACKSDSELSDKFDCINWKRFLYSYEWLKSCFSLKKWWDSVWYDINGWIECSLMWFVVFECYVTEPVVEMVGNSMADRKAGESARNGGWLQSRRNILHKTSGTPPSSSVK